MGIRRIDRHADPWAGDRQPRTGMAPASAHKKSSRPLIERQWYVLVARYLLLPPAADDHDAHEDGP